jgi:hypothetical protein
MADKSRPVRARHWASEIFMPSAASVRLRPGRRGRQMDHHAILVLYRVNVAAAAERAAGRNRR